MDDDLATRLRSELVATLRADGALRSDRWAQAFGIVPRQEFLTEFFVLADDRTTYTAVGPGDGERWLRLVYADEAWVTQLDAEPRAWARARAEGAATGAPTSSSSAPALMAAMLEALDVTGGERVLELGTGTGYNTALLCTGLSDDRVVTVEADPALAGLARERLARTGHRPTVVTGDGDRGHPDGAPYDRVIATYGVPRIPPAWTAQARTGGVIVAPFYLSSLPVGLMARLTLGEDGDACGHLLAGYGAFMPTRTLTGPDPDPGVGDAHAAPRSTPIPVGALWSAPPWLFLAALLLPPTLQVFMSGEEGQPLKHWLVAADGSWACQYEQDGQAVAAEGGPQALWSRLEHASELWARLGEPARERFGLTVAPDGGHTLWLDRPDSDHAWNLPG